MSYLPKSEQVRIRRKMEAAYGKPMYAAAKAALDALKPGLKLMNQSALGSPRGRLRRDPHAPPVGADADAQGFLPHHQLHRERQPCTGAVDPQRAALDQLITASPLGSHGAARYRTTVCAGSEAFTICRCSGKRYRAELGIKQFAMTG